MRRLARLRRFAASVVLFARENPRLLTPRNVRALWLQAQPGWLEDHRIETTDEEWDRFLEAVDALD